MRGICCFTFPTLETISRLYACMILNICVSAVSGSSEALYNPGNLVNKERKQHIFLE